MGEGLVDPGLGGSAVFIVGAVEPGRGTAEPGRGIDGFTALGIGWEGVAAGVPTLDTVEPGRGIADPGRGVPPLTTADRGVEGFLGVPEP